MILVSACLLGVNCKYDGKSNKNDKLIKFLENKEFMLICPEQLGGLSTPRLPCEIIEDKVFSKDGRDLTLNFLRGAREVENIVNLTSTKSAILKDGSPSCGSTKIYDGSFSNKKIDGKGFTSRILEAMNISIFSEDTFLNMEV